jgi:pimeloyl-ACP methyl ester carboxylesterase
MLSYDEAGAGPAVVLLHAGVADRRMWAGHLEGLAEAGHRTVAPDLAGFGESPLRAGERAPWRDLLATMDELGIERAVLVGNSFGGAVALRVALVAPDRVTGLVLISSPCPGVEPSPDLEAAWAAEEDALDRGDVDGAVAAVVDAWTLPGAADPIRELIGDMQRRIYALDDGAPEGADAADPLEDPDALSQITAPALVGAGEHDMGDFRLGAERLAELLPNARRVVIDGAGHLAPLERPADFRELALGFLRETVPAT